MCISTRKYKVYLHKATQILAFRFSFESSLLVNIGYFGVFSLRHGSFGQVKLEDELITVFLGIFFW